MHIVAIIQARMSSSRLPGKVLLPVHGKPMLQYLVERLRHCKELNQIVLATSVEASDNPVERFCESIGIECIRGPLDNVADRFSLAIRMTNADAFVRVCGDSPLLDSSLVTQAIQLLHSRQADFVTNISPRSYPKGQSVEIIRTTSYIRARDLMVGDDVEHVTSVIRNNPNLFHIENFHSGCDRGSQQMSVDTPEDFTRLEKLIASLSRNHTEYGWNELSNRAIRLFGANTVE